MKIKQTMHEFKEFILRGNILDMAIGIVVGNAFKAIVTSLVDNIIMPLVSVIGGKSVADLKWVITEAVLNAAGEVEVAEIAVQYGAFIQSIIDFLIIAASMFVVIKTIATLSNLRKKKQEAEEAAEEPVKSDEVVLLEEIRDLLKK